MAQPNDLEARLAALEVQVRELSSLKVQVRELTEEVRTSRQDAAAARVLAGGADRDVAQIREEIRDFRQATTASFNAMREDLTDLRQDMTDLRQRVDRLEGKVDRGFAEMRGVLDGTAAGQQEVVRLLDRLIAQQGGQSDEQ